MLGERNAPTEQNPLISPRKIFPQTCKHSSESLLWDISAASSWLITFTEQTL